MAARLLVITLAVLLAGFAAIGLRDHRACYEASTTIARFSLGGTGSITDGFVAEYMEKCRGSRQLAIAARALAERGRVGQAVRLADEAIRREPRNYEGWAALAAALEHRGLDGAAERARREARRLNPRFSPARG